MKTKYDRLIKVKDNQIDLLFLVDASPSSQSKIRIPQSDGTIKLFSRLEIIVDVLKKITTLHDCNVMPGTNDFGYAESLNCPDIDNGKSMPPWGTNLDGTLLDADALNNLDPIELRRFNVRIEGQHVNIGVIKISSKDDCEVISSLLDYPNNMDRNSLYKELEEGISNGDGKDYLTATRIALYELFFSPRAKQVKKRFLFYIGDGRSDTDRDAQGLLGLTRGDRVYSYKRPLDINLRRDFIISNEEPAEGTHGKLPTRYSGADKNEWYKYPVATYSFFIGVGDPRGSGIDPIAKKYAFDYEKRPGNPVGYIELTDAKNPDKEFKRLLGVVNMVDRVCYDTGFENLFSITLHNCGPHEVNLLNTLINFGMDEDPATESAKSDPYVGCTRWRTETLKQGIVSGNDLHNIKHMKAGDGNSSYGYMLMGNEQEDIFKLTDDHEFVVEATPFDDPADRIGALNLSMIPGEGGQFYNDPNNRDLLEDINSNHNILWHSFNSRYEVYRRGVLYNVDGGWSANWLKSRGVKNTGVAFRGMPVRVFRSQSTGMEIVDYNIGNASEENGYMGDYSHLPVLYRGQEIDLFFGIRMNYSMPIKNGFNAIVEKLQMVFNSKDKTMNEMQAYANMHFDLTCEMPSMSIGRANEGLEMYLPYPPADFMDEPEPEEKMELPIEGNWEIEMPAGYFHAGAKITLTLPRYPTPDGGVDKDGNIIGSTENIMVGDLVLDHDINLNHQDMKGFWDAVKTEKDITQEGTKVAELSPASLAAINAYSFTAAGVPANNPQVVMAANFTYYVQTKELYINCSAQLNPKNLSQEPPPPFLAVQDWNNSEVNISYNVEPALEEALGFATQKSADSSYSVFQFYFKAADFETSVDVSGKMNDVKNALLGAHGTFFIQHGTWAHLTDPTVEPDLNNPAAAALWTTGNFETVSLKKV